MEDDLLFMIDRLKATEKDVNELKATQIVTNYAISYITTKLILFKHIIQEATRQWTI